MSLIVVIDDERTFDTSEPILYLRNVDNALAYFADWWTCNQRTPVGGEQTVIDQLWFDHDLGEARDATSIAYFLFHLEDPEGESLPIKEIMIHSQNPVGKANLQRIAYGFCANVHLVPLPILKGE